MRLCSLVLFALTLLTPGSPVYGCSVPYPPPRPFSEHAGRSRLSVTVTDIKVSRSFSSASLSVNQVIEGKFPNKTLSIDFDTFKPDLRMSGCFPLHVVRLSEWGKSSPLIS